MKLWIFTGRATGGSSEGFVSGWKYTYAIEVRNFMTSWKDKRLGPIAQLD